MFEYKGMKTVGVTDYTIMQAPKGGVDLIMSKFNTPKNIKKYQICTK